MKPPRTASPPAPRRGAVLRTLAWTIALCGTSTCSDGSRFDPTSNVAPIADAGVGTEVLLGARVELDGAGSWDPDGDELSYAWTLTVRPMSSVAMLEGGDAASAAFTADR